MIINYHVTEVNEPAADGPPRMKLIVMKIDEEQAKKWDHLPFYADTICYHASCDKAPDVGDIVKIITPHPEPTHSDHCCPWCESRVTHQEATRVGYAYMHKECEAAYRGEQQRLDTDAMLQHQMQRTKSGIECPF